MKKKILLMTTIASLLLSGATACGSDTADSQTGYLSAGSAESEATASADAESEGENAPEESSQSSDSATDSVAIDQVIYDQDGITITADSYTTDTYKIALTVQNDTDAAVAFEYSGITVNGIRTDLDYNDFESEENVEIFISTAFSYESGDVEETLEAWLYNGGLIPAGETLQAEASLYISDTTAAYFGDIQTISFNLQPIKFTNMESQESLAYELLSGVEVNIQTDAFDGELQVPEITGTDIYNKDGIRMVMLDDPSPYNDSILEIPCYFENTTDMEIDFRIEEFSINGTDYQADISAFASPLQSQESTLDDDAIEVWDSDSAITSDITDMEFTIIILHAGMEIDRTTFTYTP